SRQDSETILQRDALAVRAQDDLSLIRIRITLDVDPCCGPGRTAYHDRTKPACILAAHRDVVTKIRLGNAVLEMSVLSRDGNRQRLALTAAVRRDIYARG